MPPIYSGPPIEELRSCLLDLSQPISKRTHAAFYLRTMGTTEAADVIATALKNRNDGSLMRHELAYILGQMQIPSFSGVLASVVDDEDEDILARHESAEAIGALGSMEFLPLLERYCDHPAPEISETCRIAVDLIKWRNRESSTETTSGSYLSVDPAPPFQAGSKTVQDCENILKDESLSLFERYRAMFTLRNMNTDESALALEAGFADSSALFRHEVAYVLGQMQRGCSVEGLAKVLRQDGEHEMVRHEAAEALGAIGTEQCREILSAYEEDSAVVVKESCHVALDTMDYWSQPSPHNTGEGNA